ncbi:MAG: ABC transporter substrate-binding protein [Burkholderiales bacterium]|nr:ABC transporter substrate-binding protein [Burkholderiales bacterium]
MKKQLVQNQKRRSVIKGIGATSLLAAGGWGFPAIAQNTPLKVGILAPRAGIAGTIGECGLRGAMFAVDKINKTGGIGGRKVELIIEEETNAKDTTERFRKLVLQDKVDCVQGIVSSGVSLAMSPTVEEMKALTIYWDGTSQDGVKETIPTPKYLFRSTDNECEAVMASLLAIKYYKGKFATIAGINPDYSYGRNNWAAFQALLKRFGIPHKVVAEQWPKVGTMDLSSNIAALKAAKPDLIFSSLLFADLPVFMQNAHAAGLANGDIKYVMPAAGFQQTLMKKEFTPEGIVFGLNTLDFNYPNASPLQKEFVQFYYSKYKDYPNWEADRAYFAMQIYKAGTEKAIKTKGGGAWPKTEEIITGIEGIEVQSLGGPGRMRGDHIAEQTFYQGLTTHKNKYDFVTTNPVDKKFSSELQKPPGMDFWQWIETAKITL